MRAPLTRSLRPVQDRSVRARRRVLVRAGTALAVLAGTALTSVTLATVAAPTASAAANLDCVGAVYLTDNQGADVEDRVLRVGLDAATSTTSVYDPTPQGDAAGNNPNQLGISAGGARAINIDRLTTAPEIVNHVRGTETTTRLTLPASTVAGSGIAGAINPNNGKYYYGNYSGSSLVLYVYDPETNATSGPVANVSTATPPPTGTANGDIAFDSAGRLYYVYSTPTAMVLYRLDNAALPTSGAPNQAFTATELTRNNALTGGAVNGIAFASDGFLYLGQATQMIRTNPITGAFQNRPGLSTPIISFPGGVSSSDLATCATPSQLTVEVTLPDGRQVAGDQFGSGFNGADYDGTPAGPTGTTSGTDTGPQNGGTEHASGLVIPGDTYTGTVTGTGGTQLPTYATYYTCTDDVSGAVVQSGRGSTFTYTPATGSIGALVTCRVTAEEPEPSISLTKTVNPVSFTAVGQVLTYTFDVRNTGNTVLDNVTVSDTMPGLSAVTCSPTQGATLQFATPTLPADTMTCTATYTVTAADVAAGTGKTNNASVAGTPPPAQGSPVSRTSTVSSANAATPPVATDDSAGTPFNTAVTLPASTNDAVGTGAIVNGSTILTAAGATNGGKTLVTTQGTWQVNAGGTVTFTPVSGYTGTTPTIQYRVTDANGLSDTGDLAVTVRPGPTASPDTATTSQDQSVTVNPLNTDTPGRNGDGSDGSFVATSVVFNPADVPSGSTITDGGKTLTVPGQGVYTINATTGVITLDPAATWVGAASAAGYTVTDSHGNTASSTIRVTVSAVDPVANDDSAETPFRTAVVLPAGLDDTPGAGGAIAPSLTILTSTSAIDGGTTLVTAQGTWQVLGDGTVRFTPAAGYTGTTPSVEYRITDTNGQSDTAELQVTVRTGPSALADVADSLQNVDVTVAPFANDTPSVRADGTTGAFDAGSVRFPTTGQPAGASVAADGLSMSVPGEGTYTVAPTTGVVTFDPDADFDGATTPVRYTVVDQAGNQTGSTIAIEVDAVTPVAGDDATKTPFETPVTLSPLTNDVPGHLSAPIAAGSIRFISPDATDGDQVLVTPQGTWQIDGDTVTFTPADGFTGATPAVEYEVADVNGTTDTATITVVVGRRPLAAPDAATTPQNTDVVVPTLGNDVAGDQGDPCAAGETAPADCDTGTIAPASVVFAATGQPGGATPTGGGRTLTIPGEGVYTIDPATGAVTFDPAPSFADTAQAVRYEATDSYGNVARSTVTVTVTPIRPVAGDDAATTAYATPVTLPAVLDDEAGAPGAALVPGATVFPTADQPAGAVIDDGGQRLTVPGQGVYVVNDEGSVTFTPAAGFSGPASPVTYRIEDENATRDTALLSVTVRPGPDADDDEAETLQGVPVGIDVLTNDTPGDTVDGTSGDWVEGSVVFPTAGQPDGATVTDGGKTLTVPGQGVYTANPDDTVTFVPAPQLTGPTTPVTYRVTDSLGNDDSAQLTVTVDAVEPSADDDSAATPFDTPVTFPFAANDDAGDPSAPIDPASGTFEAGDNPASWTISGGGTTIAVPGEGRYTLLADGTVTFTPAPGYVGTTTPVTYRIEDANGTRDTAQLTVTVQDGPSASPDDATTPQNVDVVVDVLGNDSPGLDPDGAPGAWDVTSVVFPTGGKTLEVPGEGTYTVNADGTITFDPEPGFTGPASPITYEVTDSLGNPATSTLTITVTDVDPEATNDKVRTPHHTPVLIDVLANDFAGSSAAPLDPATLLLLDPETGDEVTRVVVPGEGTWTVVDGEARFSPVRGFTGPATPLDYVVSDANGTQVSATIRVVVGPVGSAEPDEDTTASGTPVTVDVLGNDTAAPGEQLVPGSVCLLPGAGARCVTDHTVDGVGTWAVNPDGTITFTPEGDYAGTAEIGYTVQDAGGNVYESTVTVTVEPDAVAGDSGDDTADNADGDNGIDLPGTGGPRAIWLGTALGLLLLGAGLMLRRRRQPTQS